MDVYCNASMKGMPLRKKEKIKRLIETDRRYKDACRMVRFYYETNYKRGKSFHYIVFRTIYEEGIKKLQWKLAKECNMSKMTLFDYRNEIVKRFEICLAEVKETIDRNIIKEVVVTETLQVD